MINGDVHLDLIDFDHEAVQNGNFTRVRKTLSIFLVFNIIITIIYGYDAYKICLDILGPQYASLYLTESLWFAQFSIFVVNHFLFFTKYAL